MGDYSIKPIGKGIVPDYAAEFAKKAELQNAYMKGMLDALIQKNLVKGNSRTDVNGMNSMQGTDLENENPYMYKGYKKQRVEEMKNKYLEYGVADGTKIESEKQAKKLAKAFVENEENKYELYSTRTIVSKSDYKKAEKEKQARKKELQKQYRNEGLSRKEAKQKANAQLIVNERLKNKKTIEFMEQHREMFYDDKGELSQEKVKSFVKGLMNTHTDENEVDNYHMSLKERREQALNWGIDDDVLANLCKAAGGDFEKDYTELRQAAVIAGTTAVGLLIGSAIKTEATAGATATDAAGNMHSGAVGAAKVYAHAEVNHMGTGGGIGFGLGTLLSKFAKDKGGKEDKVYDYAKPEEKNVVPDDDQGISITSCDYFPDQIDDSHDVPEETCTYTLKKGESLYDAVRDGYGLKDHKEIMKFVHALKDRYGYKYSENCWQADWEMPELFGKKFTCDVDVKGTLKPQDYNSKGKAAAKKDFSRKSERVENHYYFIKDCNGNQVGEYYDDAATRNAALKELQDAENARVKAQISQIAGDK